MSTQTNFTVVGYGGYVDIFPHSGVALSGEGVAMIIEQIKTELPFNERIIAGDRDNSDEPSLRFAIRLPGASAEMAQRLREMDLFTSLQSEGAAPEVRYVYDGLAYVDPRQVLTVEQLIAFGDLLRSRFGKRSGFSLQNGQFVYGTEDCFRLNDEAMVEVCNPLFKHSGHIQGGYRNGRLEVILTAPAGTLKLDDIWGVDHVIRNPGPVLKYGSTRSRYDIMWIPLDTEPVETAVDVERLYEMAKTISLNLGIHPHDNFTFFHKKDLQTTYSPSPLSSR